MSTSLILERQKILRRLTIIDGDRLETSRLKQWRWKFYLHRVTLKSSTKGVVNRSYNVCSLTTGTKLGTKGCQTKGESMFSLGKF